MTKEVERMKNKSLLSKIITVILVIVAIAIYFAYKYLDNFLNRPKGHLLNNIEFSSNGDYLCASTREGNVLWKVDDGSIIFSHRVESFLDACSKISPDNCYCVNSGGFTVKICDINTKTTSFQKRSGRFIGFFPDSKDIICQSESSPNELDLINIPTRERTKIKIDSELKMTFKTRFNMLAQKKDGSPILVIPIEYIGNSDELPIVFYDILRNRISNRIKVPMQKNDIRGIFSGGDKLYIFTSNLVKIVSINDRNIKTVKFKDPMFGIFTYIPCCIANDGKMFAVAHKITDEKSGKDKLVARIYDLNRDDEYKEIPLTIKQPVQYMAIHPEKNLLAVGFQRILGRGKRGRIVLYNFNTGEKSRELEVK